jgi:hypothetical protein
VPVELQTVFGPEKLKPYLASEYNKVYRDRLVVLPVDTNGCTTVVQAQMRGVPHLRQSYYLSAETYPTQMPWPVIN